MRAIFRQGWVALTLFGCGGVDATSPAERPASGLRIELTHATRLVPAGGQIRIQARTHDKSVRIPVSLVWTSDDPTIATVTQSGWVTGLTVGEVTIRAAYDTAQASIRIRVEPASLAVVAHEGSPDLAIGESVILKAEYRDLLGKSLPSHQLRYDWITGDTAVVRLTPVADRDDSYVRVTALSTGLASLSVGTQAMLRRFIVGVIPEMPPADAPVRVSDFHFVTYWDDAFAYVPSMQVVVAAGRSVEVTRVEVAVPSQFPKQLPALCSSGSLPGGTHALIGVESYPYSAFSYYGYYPTYNSEGVALLTYRTETGREIQLLARGAVENWSNASGLFTSFPWRVCPS